MAKTILIVDGNNDRLKRLRRVVSGWGYTVLQAESGTEALDLVAAGPPPAMLVGSRLADLDVDVLVRRIKRRFRDVEVDLLAATLDLAVLSPERIVRNCPVGETGCF